MEQFEEEGGIEEVEAQLINKGKSELSDITNYT